MLVWWPRVLTFHSFHVLMSRFYIRRLGSSVVGNVARLSVGRSRVRILGILRVFVQLLRDGIARATLVQSVCFIGTWCIHRFIFLSAAGLSRFIFSSYSCSISLLSLSLGFHILHSHLLLSISSLNRNRPITNSTSLVSASAAPSSRLSPTTASHTPTWSAPGIFRVNFQNVSSDVGLCHSAIFPLAGKLFMNSKMALIEFADIWHSAYL